MSQNNLNPCKLAKPFLGSPTTSTSKNQSLFKERDILNLGKALSACSLVQRTYGKQAADIDKVTKVFAKILSQYEPDKVIDAIGSWLTNSTDFPTPADIVRIVAGKQKLDPGIYQRAQRVAADSKGEFSDAYDRKEAKKYCRYYEREIIGHSLT